METKSIETRITEQPFFKDLDPDYIKLFASCASEVTFKNGHFLLTQGNDADYFYMITDGKVHIEAEAGDRGQITIENLCAGDILGWSWLIPPYKWRFDALAVEPTSAIAFDGKQLRKLCEENKPFGYEMLKRMIHIITHRLLSTRMKLMEFYG